MKRVLSGVRDLQYLSLSLDLFRQVVAPQRSVCIQYIDCPGLSSRPYCPFCQNGSCRNLWLHPSWRFPNLVLSACAELGSTTSQTAAETLRPAPSLPLCAFAPTMDRTLDPTHRPSTDHHDDDHALRGVVPYDRRKLSCQPCRRGIGCQHGSCVPRSSHVVQCRPVRPLPADVSIPPRGDGGVDGSSSCDTHCCSIEELLYTGMGWNAEPTRGHCLPNHISSTRMVDILIGVDR